MCQTKHNTTTSYNSPLHKEVASNDVAFILESMINSLHINVVGRDGL